MQKFKGIFPALVTPFDRDGKINEKALRSLVESCIRRGVNGFYIDGTTAEALLMTLEERKRVMEIVADQNAGRGTVICHVGCLSTEWAIELGRHAKAAGADAISSLPPFYFNFSRDEIIGYYTDLATAVGLPFFIYNYPASSQINFTDEDLKRLFAVPEIIGVKHTSLNMFQLEGMKSLKPDVVILNGHDEVALSGISMGADGAVGSTFNIIPEIYIDMLRLYAEGKNAEALALQKKANEVVRILLSIGLIPGVKCVLEHMGIEGGQSRRPFRPLSEEAKKKAQYIYENCVVKE